MESEGLGAPPVAGPDDLADGLMERLGNPGDPPYTRGIRAETYSQRPWVVRQLAGYGSGADTNERFRFLLDRGATGVNCVFDYPTLRAFDSDDPQAAPDVGRGGVAIDLVDDMADLFLGIPIGEISVSLVSSQPIGAVAHLAMYLAVARQRGVGWERLRGTSQNDFLMETCVTIGPETLPPASALRLECDLAEFCIGRVPLWNPVSVAAYNYREAGADAVLEVALAIAHGLAVGEELVRRGIEPDRAARCITFFFSAHMDLFDEVAKFRAARRIWHRVTSERLGCQDPRATRLRFHAQTAGMSFSARAPLLNIGRGAIEAFAAIAGGAQSLHVNGYDEAFTIPTRKSAAIALATHRMLFEETGLAGVIDPFGGSFLVEHLTDVIEQQVEDALGAIAERGGIVGIVETGWLHRELGHRALLDHQASSATDASGPEAADSAADGDLPSFALPSDTRERQAARLETARADRDDLHVERALSCLREAALGGRVLPAVIEAVEARATIGEVGAALRAAFGTWTVPLP